MDSSRDQLYMFTRFTSRIPHGGRLDGVIKMGAHYLDWPGTLQHLMFGRVRQRDKAVLAIANEVIDRSRLDTIPSALGVHA